MSEEPGDLCHRGGCLKGEGNRFYEKDLGGSKSDIISVVLHWLDWDLVMNWIFNPEKSGLKNLSLPGNHSVSPMLSKNKEHISGKLIFYKIPPKKSLLTPLYMVLAQLIFLE